MGKLIFAGRLPADLQVSFAENAGIQRFPFCSGHLSSFQARRNYAAKKSWRKQQHSKETEKEEFILQIF